MSDAWIYLVLIAAGYCAMWIRVATTSAPSQRRLLAGAGRRSGLVMFYTGLGLILGVHVEVATANRAAIEADAARNRMLWDGPLVGTIAGFLVGVLALALLQIRERSQIDDLRTRQRLG